MDDPLLVRGFQRLRNLFRDRQGFIEGKTGGSERTRPTCDELRERRALDELHDQRTDAARFFEPVDVRDVRMIE